MVDRVITENANRTRNAGEIDPDNFSPYPKNPVIASFFKEIGRADELGSGVRNTFKYCGIYTHGATPKLIEDDVFKTIIPLEPAKNDEINGGKGLGMGWEEGWEKVRERFGKGSGKVRERFGKSEIKILGLAEQDKKITIPELAENIGISERAVKKNIRKLKEKGVLERVGGRKEGHWEIQ